MSDVTCADCGDTVPDGDHWVHVSVFHHDREGNPNEWSRDDPKNTAFNVCPDCADERGLIDTLES